MAEAITKNDRDGRNEKRLRLLTDAVPILISYVDKNHRYQFNNKSYEDWFGHRREDIEGRHVKEVLGDIAYEILRVYIDRALAGETVVYETSVPYRHGGERYIHATYVPDFDQSGFVEGFYVLVDDITERKSLEERLRQSHKLDALGRLAGGIAHDFNNLLLPIITIAEVTRDDFPPGGRQWANLDKVVKAGQRGRALVDKILKFSRRQPTHRQPVNLVEVVEEALELARALMHPMIQVRAHLDDDVGTVLADSNQIHEVIMNLVSNAGQAIGLDKGVIDVSLRKASVDDAGGAPTSLQAGTYALLTVSDSGVGMDDETQTNIFDPFFTTKPAGEGTGMGLAAVHGIVAQHDGAISVSSKPGEETTFEIHLPILD